MAIAEFSTSRIRSKVHGLTNSIKRDFGTLVKIIDNEDNQACGLVWFEPPSQHSLDFLRSLLIF